MSRARPLKIRGVGRYLPHRIVSNDEAGAACGLSAAEVHERSGVLTRRRAAGPGESASVMGALAAREALDEAGLSAGDLDLVLNASATPEQALPDTAPFVHQELGLGRSGVPAMSVSAACLSFLAALDMAASLLATDRYRHILIVSAEISSVGLDVSDRETGPLFGDGAAAVVVTQPEAGDSAALHAVRFETYSEGAALTGIPGCGTRRPPSHPDTRVADSLFRMNGPALLRVAARHGRPFLKRFAHDLGGVPYTDALLIPHQPSRAGLNMCQALGFPPERTVTTLEELGNCVAASMPLTLCEAVRSGRLARGDKALLLGTGAGVTFGASLLTYQRGRFMISAAGVATRPRTILLTGGRAPATLELARLFDAAGYRVIVAEGLVWPVTRGSRSVCRHYRVPAPRQAPHAFAAALVDVVRAECVD